MVAWQICLNKFIRFLRFSPCGRAILTNVTVSILIFFISQYELIVRKSAAGATCQYWVVQRGFKAFTNESDRRICECRASRFSSLIVMSRPAWKLPHVVGEHMQTPLSEYSSRLVVHGHVFCAALATKRKNQMFFIVISKP